jgi:hypothetical protein
MAKLYKTRRRREVAGVKIAKVFRIRVFKGRHKNILDFLIFISNPLPSLLRGFSASNAQVDLVSDRLAIRNCAEQHKRRSTVVFKAVQTSCVKTRQAHGMSGYGVAARKRPA